MLRIANWYQVLHRNDGNPLFVTSFLKRVQYYQNILTGRGVNQELLKSFTNKNLDPMAEAYAKEWLDKGFDPIEIEHINPDPNADFTKFGKFDLNIWVDWGEDGLTGVLPYTPLFPDKPVAYWASDTHIHDASYQFRLGMAKKANFVFAAQKRAVEEFKKDGVDAIWLPHAVEPLAYPKTDFASKKYDVCFVGHINTDNRIDALDRLFKEFPNFFYGQRLFEQAAEVYSNSKIVFNISMTDDINMRTFEGMATGSFVLTNWIPTIEDLFEDGKHLVLYRSLDEMVDKAKYYLAHDDEREKIAQAGYEEVMAKHTMKHRVDVILNEYLKSKQPKEALSASV